MTRYEEKPRLAEAVRTAPPVSEQARRARDSVQQTRPGNGVPADGLPGRPHLTGAHTARHGAGSGLPT